MARQRPSTADYGTSLDKGRALQQFPQVTGDRTYRYLGGGGGYPPASLACTMARWSQLGHAVPVQAVTVFWPTTACSFAKLYGPCWHGARPGGRGRGRGLRRPGGRGRGARSRGDRVRHPYVTGCPARPQCHAASVRRQLYGAFWSGQIGLTADPATIAAAQPAAERAGWVEALGLVGEGRLSVDGRPDVLAMAWPAGLALANLLAFLPGRAATRLRPAVVLRGE